MNTSENQPLVSVVTPVYNGESYISECIESVIGQTYKHWEYVIVNNCSTDATAEIAENYASKDSRIRVSNNKEFLDIIPNWNHALRQIPFESKYCKVLHADDILFPECIEKMVELAEANPSVGIVASYRVDGPKGVHKGGLHHLNPVISGREVCRNTLRRQYFIFGSASTRLIRADLIRKRKAYYNEAYYHADTAECFEQLQNCYFGFVHQVLSYTRRHADTQSVTFAQRYQTDRIERLLWLKEYGPAYFDRDELKELFDKEKRWYCHFLIQQILKGREKDFFDYHKKRLNLYGLYISRKKLVCFLIRRLIVHPADINLLFKTNWLTYIGS